MDTILDLGLEITIWFQSLGTWFLPIMSFFSFLGSVSFFLFLAPIIYWCLDPILGVRVGLFLLINGGVNSVFKIIFHSPRPYWYSEDVKAYTAESSFGLPSGHAQTSIVVWGTIALKLQRVWVWLLTILTIFFIGISRIYLGVHFPSDVLFGWLIGIVILWLLIRLEYPFLSWFNEHHWTFQTFFLFVISIGSVGLFALIASISGKDNLTQTWIDTAAMATTGVDPIEPYSISNIITFAGAFLGMAGGAIWVKRRGWFSTKDPIWQLLLRYPIGLFGVIILYSGLGALIPNNDDLVSQILEYLRFGLVGFWIIGGAPELFKRLGLAKTLL